MRELVCVAPGGDGRQPQRRHQDLPSAELAEQIRTLYALGVHHVGYYPDMLFENHPAPAQMRAVFSLKDNNPEVD